MLISDGIAHVRLEITDTNTTRFQDSDYLKLFKKAIFVVEPLLYQFDIPFARKRYSFDTVDGQQTYSLPSDFGSVHSMYREDTAEQVSFNDIDDFESIISAPTCGHFTVMDDNGTDKIWLKDTPGSVITLLFHYYPTTDVSALTTASSIPWGGKLDYVVTTMVTYLANNIDELDSSVENADLQGFATRLLAKYRAQNQVRIRRRGWNN